ncbi:MAG TPA: zinc ribbon domain-containing protein [Candidatus Anammoximicrobium sp.]|nr:zinc ribbon domain-containing protein [Candidatus Anammoximicrobium sp.]
MRLIVACQQCKRQYDASGRQPGDRFRCRCGQTVIVQEPRGHEAAVVRCSSCGATRERNAEQCAHCGADFTIHEQDLDTVCPNCLARVSDRARYCHHCAALLIAEGDAGDATSFCCPVCGPQWQLTSRAVRDTQMHVMECQKCGGFWIGLETFDRLLDREARQPQSAGPAGGPQELPPRSPYRPCAVCGQLMVRRNFGRTSGVIVDICGSHGIWFDAQELARVLRWIRSGNLEAARDDLACLVRSPDLARKRKLRRRSQPEHRPSSPMPLGSGSDDDDFPLEEIAEGAIRVIRTLFRMF